jgi:hypothetical protein
LKSEGERKCGGSRGERRLREVETGRRRRKRGRWRRRKREKEEERERERKGEIIAHQVF